jgi:hypothetical protein
MFAPRPVPPEPLETASIVPNIDHIVTEDDAPVDNLFSEKQQRLLTEPLYSSWLGPGDERPFVAAANVGVFAAVHQPPLVPNVFLSLDVQAPPDLWPKRHRSYFLWEYGKPPDVAIEIASVHQARTSTGKSRDYARIGVSYYVLFDPDAPDEPLRLYALHAGRYAAVYERWLPEIGLGLTLWRGAFEGLDGRWLRWCDQYGEVIPTGAERAEQERARAEQERARADRLADRLRALGVDPEDVRTWVVARLLTSQRRYSR